MGRNIKSFWRRFTLHSERFLYWRIPGKWRLFILECVHPKSKCDDICYKFLCIKLKKPRFLQECRITQTKMKLYTCAILVYLSLSGNIFSWPWQLFTGVIHQPAKKWEMHRKGGIYTKLVHNAQQYRREVKRGESQFFHLTLKIRWKMPLFHVFFIEKGVNFLLYGLLVLF